MDAGGPPSRTDGRVAARRPTVARRAWTRCSSPRTASTRGWRRWRARSRGTHRPGSIGRSRSTQWFTGPGSSFTYDLSTAPGNGDDALVEFLTSGRRGYCEQFASAMAVMLRTLGVPARVAVGFTGGRDAAGARSVGTADAHAWVEAWFPGAGWTTFDPDAADRRPRDRPALRRRRPPGRPTAPPGSSRPRRRPRRPLRRRPRPRRPVRPRPSQRSPPTLRPLPDAPAPPGRPPPVVLALLTALAAVGGSGGGRADRVAGPVAPSAPGRGGRRRCRGGRGRMGRAAGRVGGSRRTGRSPATPSGWRRTG